MQSNISTRGETPNSPLDSPSKLEAVEETGEIVVPSKVDVSFCVMISSSFGGMGVVVSIVGGSGGGAVVSNIVVISTVASVVGRSFKILGESIGAFVVVINLVVVGDSVEVVEVVEVVVIVVLVEVFVGLGIGIFSKTFGKMGSSSIKFSST